jgi:hypothetical protein
MLEVRSCPAGHGRSTSMALNNLSYCIALGSGNYNGLSRQPYNAALHLRAVKIIDKKCMHIPFCTCMMNRKCSEGNT